MGRGAMRTLLRSSSLELSQACKRPTRCTSSKSPTPTLSASMKVKNARMHLKYWAMVDGVYARSDASKAACGSCDAAAATKVIEQVPI